MAARQAKQAVCDFRYAGLRIGDIVDAAQVSLTKVELHQPVEPQQYRGVIESRIAAHAGRHRQGFGRLLTAPQQNSIECLVVEIIKGAVARQGGVDFRTLLAQFVGEGEIFRIGLADGQEAQGCLIVHKSVGLIDRHIEGLTPRVVFFFGHTGADHVLDAYGNLLRVGVTRENHVPAFRHREAVVVARHDNRDAAWPGGSA